MPKTIAPTVSPQFGGEARTYTWQWQGRPRAVACETLGAGRPVLLLPALSTVSCRAELSQLAASLARHFQVSAIDWPGFGESERSPLAYCPALYRQFLQDFVRATFAEPPAVVAAGHGAGYAIELGATAGCWSRVALLAPTWRGPLAVMGVPPAVRASVRALVRSPGIGPMLYGLNTRPAFLKWMYRRHVFVDSALLTPDYIARRYRTTQHPNARYAPAAFVTGGLDPVEAREQLLADIEKLAVPILAVIAEQAPPASRAEMEAIAALPNVSVARATGTLGLAEEYGEAVAEIVRPFLQAG